MLFEAVAALAELIEDETVDAAYEASPRNVAVDLVLPTSRSTRKLQNQEGGTKLRLGCKTQVPSWRLRAVVDPK
jgi:hypothetical protein